MKDNISRRRFYLNKKDKSNSYNINDIKGKNNIVNLKKEKNDNKKKLVYPEDNLDKNLNLDKKDKNINEQSKIRNFILYPDKIESNNSPKNKVKNINYYSFSIPNKILFSPNNNINNYNLFKKQENNNFVGNNNNSFETNKLKEKEDFYNKDMNIKKYEKDNKMDNILSNVKITDNLNKEKKKEKNYSEKKYGFFRSFYGFRNKKKEIIKIQSTWKGYYFRKVKNIKKYIFLNSFIKLLENIFNNSLKILYNEFVKILKNISVKQYKYGNMQQINFKEKYNNFSRGHYTSNNISNYMNIHNYYIIPNNENNNINSKAFTKLNEIKKENNKKENEGKKKEKEKSNNDIDDIFNYPFKIIYIPKKAYNKNRYYYMKRVTKIKKIKLEEFFKFIKKKFLSSFFTNFKNKYKYNSDYFKKKKLFVVLDSIIKNYKKKYLNIYREKILDKKVNEEIIKKKTLLIEEEKINNIKLFKNKKYLNENKLEKKAHNKLKKNLDKNIKVIFKENNLVNEIIVENINESENEEDNQIININNNKDYFLLLNKIIRKKIKYNISILNKYFNQWKQFNKNGKKIKIRNMHSPDIEIRGNKNKKRHIKIKFSKALTSKTSLSSIKSEGRSNSSSHFYIKKMRVRSVVINNFDHSIINYKTDNNYKKYIKLSNIIERIDNKISTIKCFKNWKKNKRNRRDFSKK